MYYCLVSSLCRENAVIILSQLRNSRKITSSFYCSNSFMMWKKGNEGFHSQICCTNSENFAFIQNCVCIMIFVLMKFFEGRVIVEIEKIPVTFQAPTCILSRNKPLKKFSLLYFLRPEFSYLGRPIILLFIDSRKRVPLLWIIFKCELYFILGTERVSDPLPEILFTFSFSHFLSLCLLSAPNFSLGKL